MQTKYETTVFEDHLWGNPYRKKTELCLVDPAKEFFSALVINGDDIIFYCEGTSSEEFETIHKKYAEHCEDRREDMEMARRIFNSETKGNFVSGEKLSRILERSQDFHSNFELRLTIKDLMRKGAIDQTTHDDLLNIDGDKGQSNGRPLSLKEIRNKDPDLAMLIETEMDFSERELELENLKNNTLREIRDKRHARSEVEHITDQDIMDIAPAVLEDMAAKDITKLEMTRQEFASFQRELLNSLSKDGFPFNL